MHGNFANKENVPYLVAIYDAMISYKIKIPNKCVSDTLSFKMMYYLLKICSTITATHDYKHTRFTMGVA